MPLRDIILSSIDVSVAENTGKIAGWSVPPLSVRFVAAVRLDEASFSLLLACFPSARWCPDHVRRLHVTVTHAGPHPHLRSLLRDSPPLCITSRTVAHQSRKPSYLVRTQQGTTGMPEVRELRTSVFV